MVTSAPSKGNDRDRLPHLSGYASAVIAAVCLLGLGAIAVKLLTEPGFLGARGGLRYMTVYAVTSGGLAGACAVLTARWRRGLVRLVAVLCFVAILLVLALSGTLGSAGLAACTVIVAYSVGWGVWRAILGTEPPWPCAVTVGAGLLALVIFLEGIGGALRTWDLAWPLVGVALILTVLGTRGGGPLAFNLRSASTLCERIAGQPLDAAAFVLVSVLAVWSAFWAAAPEIQFDALNVEAWLPQLWAQSGRIVASTYTAHPQVAVTGNVELLAVPGHLLGQVATGRLLQYFAYIAVVACVWWYLDKRHVPLAPLWAVVTAVTPQLIWQGSTAYEDAVTAFFCLGLTVAASELLGQRSAATWQAALVLGALTGSCIAAKLTVAPFAGTVLFGSCLLSQRRLGNIANTVLAGGAGLFIVWAPQRFWFWVMTGSPLFPLYNNIFRSPDFPPISANYNFPYYKPHGLLDLLLLPLTSAVSPSKLVEATPAGGYGLLLFLLFAVLLLGWNRDRPHQLIWTALVVGFLAWWLEVRYLRLLVEYMPIGVILLVAPSRRPLARLPMALRQLVTHPGFVAFIVVISFPPTLASFWNVPSAVPLRVDLGLESATTYEDIAIGSAPATFAFDRLARPGSVVIGDAYARALLRPGLDLTQSWEFEEQQGLRRPLPTTPNGIYNLARARGVNWALVATNGVGAIGSDQFTRDLVRTHGELTYAADNYNLYKLVPRPVDISGFCTPGTVGPSCALYRDVTASAGTNLTACPGATYALTVATNGAGSWRAWLIFPAAPWDSSYITVGNGASGTVYDTAPGRPSTLLVSVTPMQKGGEVSEVTLRTSAANEASCQGAPRPPATPGTALGPPLLPGPVAGSRAPLHPIDQPEHRATPPTSVSAKGSLLIGAGRVYP